MAASYPASVPVYSTKLANQVIDPGHVNILQEELVALVSGLLNGVAHGLKPDTTGGNRDLGLSGQRFRHLWLNGDATIAGAVAITGNVAAGSSSITTFNGTATFTSVLALNGGLNSGGAVNLQDNQLIRPEIKDYAETKTAPTISSGTLTLDYTTGQIFEVSVNANITTFSITNWPATGKKGSIEVWFKGDGTARTQAWGSVRWPSDVAPTLTSVNGDYTVITFHTFDGGTTVFGIPGAFAL